MGSLLGELRWSLFDMNVGLRYVDKVYSELYIMINSMEISETMKVTVWDYRKNSCATWIKGIVQKKV